MAMFRRVRKRHKIRISGPAVITVAAGQASVHIDAEATVKIEHETPKPPRLGLTPPLKKR